MLERTLTADGYVVVGAGDGGSALVELERSVREAGLLELLLRNRAEVVTRAEEPDHAWGGTAAASLNVVDRYISYLRRKLGEPQLIQTVRGVGFMLGR